MSVVDEGGTLATSGGSIGNTRLGVLMTKHFLLQSLAMATSIAVAAFSGARATGG